MLQLRAQGEKPLHNLANQAIVISLGLTPGKPFDQHKLAA